jgi:hypothetical protein
MSAQPAADFQLALVGFQPALVGCEDLRIARKSRLKGGYSQDWLPHVGCHSLALE